jgi:hypothetical protein
LPLQIQGVQVLEYFQAGLPELLEHPGSSPFLEAVVDGAFRAEAAGQAGSLAAVAQQVEDGG